jgi:hypothetical protein
MRIFQKLLLLVILASSMECQEEVVNSRPYPRILTRDVANISPAGATFEADITYRGGFEILEYGFVWANETPTLEVGERIAIIESPSTDHLTVAVTSGLIAKQFYQVRAYLITKDHIVLGNIVNFQSQGSVGPVLSDYSPKTAKLTDTITVTGRSFSRHPENNPVFFGSSRAPVISASDTLLKVLVPEELTQSQATVSIAAGNSHPTPFTLIVPSILSVSPTGVKTCDTLQVMLDGLGPSARVGCFIGDVEAEVIGRSSDKIFARVPVVGLSPEAANVRVIVGLFDLTFSGSVNYLPSAISRVDPPLAGFLDTLTVHFTQKPLCDLKIKIDGKPVSILASGGDSVRVIVPGQLNHFYDIVIASYVGDILFATFNKPRALKINSVTPAAGSPGDIVTIRGIGFHPTLNQNVVCFNCQGTGFGDHGVILSGNTRELVVQIPVTAPNQIGISIFTQNLGALPFPFEVY